MYVENFDRIRMDQQIRNLNCGRNCMESALEWRHGSRYGAEVLNNGQLMRKIVNGRVVLHIKYGCVRTAHTPEVQAHRDDGMAYGFSPYTHNRDYGLLEIRPAPRTVQQWEDRLDDYGPLIVSGHIGAVEALWKGAGHNVLVIGVMSDKIIYLDPLGTVVGGGLAFFGARKRNANREMTMDLNSFNSKVDKTIGAVMGTCPPMDTGWGNATRNVREEGGESRIAIGGRRS